MADRNIFWTIVWGVLSTGCLLSHAFADPNTLSWKQILESRIDTRVLASGYLPGRDFPYLSLVDIDNDGDLDMFTGNQDGSLELFTNVGNARNPVWSRPQGEYAGIASTNGFSAPDFFDRDLDGDMDLVLGDGAGYFWYYANTGSVEEAAWSSATLLQTNTNIKAQFGARPCLIDYSGDGEADLFFMDKVGTYDVYNVFQVFYYEDMLAGPGTDFQLVSADFAGSNIKIEHKLRPPALPISTLTLIPPPAIELGDLDEDGDLDFILGTLDTRPEYYLNTSTNASGVWSNIYLFEPRNRLEADQSIEMADLDDDGDTDIIMSAFNGSIARYFAVENPEAAWAFSPNDMVYGIAGLDFGFYTTIQAVDIDGDGDDDILGSEQFGYTLLIENIGTPASTIHGINQNGDLIVTDRFFDELSIAPDSPFPIEYMVSPTAGDLDGDGDLDIYTGDRDGTFYHFENVGTRYTPAFIQRATPWAGLSYSQKICPMLHDVNLDGLLDLFIGRDDGQIDYYQNVGSATQEVWSAVSTNYFGVNTGGRAAPAFGDLDGDGDADCLIGRDDGTLTLVENIGSPTQTIWGSITHNYGGIDVGEASHPTMTDRDGDGDLDLVLGQKQGSVIVFHNQRATLDLHPPLVSVTAGANLTFTSSLTNVTWSFVANRTGATLNPSNGLYTAGTAPVSGGHWNRYMGGDRVWNDPAITNSVPIPMDGGQIITNMEVALSLYHEDHSDLLIQLISPAGTTVTLHNQSAGTNTFVKLYHDVNGIPADGPGALSNFYGERAVGPWQMVFNDRVTNGPAGDARAKIISCAVTVNGGEPPVDVIQAVSTNGARGLSFVNVVDRNDIGRYGKAMILAGGKSLSDPVWAATDNLANKAYNLLLLKGFSKSNIFYSSFVPDRDIDGNGNALDDIDAAASSVVASNAFTQFAANAEQLFIYMVDHGSDSVSNSFFRLNGSPGENISATQYADWIKRLQTNGVDRIVSVMDFCYAGRFVKEAANAGVSNTVQIASCATNELTYFIANGQVSFSDAFFNGILQGSDVASAYEFARESMLAHQTAILDDTGDGEYEAGLDGQIAQNFSIGGTTSIGRDLPQITEVSPNRSLNGKGNVLLYATGVNSPFEVDRVWAVVVPPNHRPNLTTGEPVTDLPELDLIYNPSTERYEGSFSGFNEAGSYKIVFFAQDAWGGVSYPKQTYVVQDGVNFGSLLVTGGPVSLPNFTPYERVSNLGYNAMRSRLISDQNIVYLSPSLQPDIDGDSSNEVDAVSSLGSIGNAITNTLAGNDEIGLIFIGHGTNNTLQISSNEFLTAAQLDAWLDAFQHSNQTVGVLLDFSGAGAFIPVLAQSNRLIIASSAENRESQFGSGISFSDFFFSEIVQGKSVGEAANIARRGVRRASGTLHQRALIDDNGNGIPNEKNVDGVDALNEYLGSPFVTGEDIPHIGGVMPETVLTNTASLQLWADSVSDADGISNVVVYITTPTNILNSLTLDLSLTNNPVSQRWETTFDFFIEPGRYTLTFFAQDNKGNVSPAVQSEIWQTSTNFSLASGAGPDRYEPDNSSTNAVYSDLPLLQLHSLHTAEDSDWVRINVLSNFVYDIETIHLGTNIDTRIELYRQQTNGLILIDTVDEFGYAEGELTGLDFTNGTYYLKISHDTNFPHQAGGYVLAIYVPAGFQGINVFAVDILNLALLQGLQVNLRTSGGVLITNKVIGTDLAFGDATLVNFNVSPGNYLVEVLKTNGLARAFSTVNSNEVPLNPATDYGNPRNLGDFEFGTVAYGGGSFSESTFMAFEFFPIVCYTGEVRAVISGAPVEGAAVDFTRDSDTVSFDRYPWAAYAAPWQSQPDGALPTTLWLLPDTPHTLTVSKPGYADRVVVIPPVPQGSLTDLGTLLLDSEFSGNNVADHFEIKYSLPVSGVTTNDTDHDGLTLEQEWIANTNPGDDNSRLFIPEVLKTNGLLRITWKSEPFRVYKVISCPDLVTPLAVWHTEFGPWTNTSPIPENTWSAPIDSLSNQYFTIQVALP